MGSRTFRIIVELLLLLASTCATAEQVPVRHPQGWAHGFVEITTPSGQRLGVGDLLQRVRGKTVSSRLLLKFFDGSVDDETTVYAQEKMFRLISDHHVQRGPSFPKAIDTTIDTQSNTVTVKDDAGHPVQAQIDMPVDLYNGLASTLLMNLKTPLPATRIAIVIGGEKPRIAHLSMKSVGERRFTLGGVSRTASEFVVQVELGGVAGVVAPILGKQPPDYHVLIAAGSDPAFIREEGPLFEGGPIWRIQQISAVVAEQ